MSEEKKPSWNWAAGVSGFFIYIASLLVVLCFATWAIWGWDMTVTVDGVPHAVTLGKPVHGKR